MHGFKMKSNMDIFHWMRKYKMIYCYHLIIYCKYLQFPLLSSTAWTALLYHNIKRAIQQSNKQNIKACLSETYTY